VRLNPKRSEGTDKAGSVTAKTTQWLKWDLAKSGHRGSSFIAYLSNDFIDHLLREEPSQLMTIYCADNGG
jgi:hypothetical protein